MIKIVNQWSRKSVIIAEMANKDEPRQIRVNAGTIVGSTYAQIVGVTVSDTEITLEFVYKHPREDINEAQVVSRVTLPRPAGEELASAIVNTIKIHEAKKKEGKHATN